VGIGSTVYGFEEVVRLLDMVVGSLVGAEHTVLHCSVVDHLKLAVQTCVERLRPFKTHQEYSISVADNLVQVHQHHNHMLQD
jgi:hypothetical protein